MEKVAKLSLGILYPILALALGLGSFFGEYSELPGRITVHFDITRMPTTSLSTPTFGVLMTTILVISVLACVFIAVKKKSPASKVNHEIASFGGFCSAVVASLMAGAVVIHQGLTNWRDAIGPGWWILLVVFAGFAGASATKFLAIKIHG
jgi:hypothetical protein